MSELSDELREQWAKAATTATRATPERYARALADAKIAELAMAMDSLATVTAERDAAIEKLKKLRRLLLRVWREARK